MPSNDLQFSKNFAILPGEMPISILGLNRKDDGQSEHHNVTFSSIEDVELAKPFIASVTITKLRHDIYDAQITGDIAIKVDCHRCLKRFSRPLHVDFHVVFADEPGEEEWPINRNDIDLEEPVRQEILFLTPVQMICSEECNGIQANN